MPLETINTVVVQDREYGQDGKPLINQEVTIRLAPGVIFLIPANTFAGQPDQVALQATEVRTKTDSTGFWSLSLVSNNVITPANTYYSVKVGLLKQYDIAIPAGAGPFIASNNLTGALPLFPGGSSVAGPITITGNLTVTGTGTFQGALAAQAGLTVTGGGSVTGGWTIGGLLTMTDAASRLVPGATSFSVRDNANLNDNLLVTNAGNATVRGNLTVTGGPLTVSAGGASITGGLTVATGDETISAGRLVFGAAAAKIIPGASSVSLRNNADTADNVLVADAGLVTLRNAVSIPPAAGGTLPPTSYGTLTNKVDEQTPSSGTAITINLPPGGRHAEIEWTIRDNSANASDLLQLTFNADSGTNYDYGVAGLAAGAWTTPVPATGVAFIRAGIAAGGTTGAGIFNKGIIEIFDYTEAVSRKLVLTRCSRNDATAFGMDLTHGDWHPATPVAITSVTLTLAAGAFVAGCRITTRVKP